MERAVVVAVLCRGGRVLLVKRAASRAFFPGVWDLPGGHGEDGEAPEQTLTRELAEEIGVVPQKYVEAPIDHVTVEGLRLRCFYVIRWTGSPRNLQEHEHSEVTWVPIADINRLDLASPVILRLVRSSPSISQSRRNL